VAEEIGKALAPEPFVESVVLTGGLVAVVGTDAQRSDVLGALAAGNSLVVLAHAEPGTRWATTAARVTATRNGDGWRLDGVKEPVQHGARADRLVVSAVVDGRTQLFLVPGDAEGLTRTHDSGRAAKLTFASTPPTLLGDGDADRSDNLAHALARAQVAYCHEAVGAVSTALTMTSEYLKSRKQFGVTLNKFQALTFRAADMYVSLELVRSVVLWATMVIADGSTETSAVMAADRARLQHRHDTVVGGDGDFHPDEGHPSAVGDPGPPQQLGDPSGGYETSAVHRRRPSRSAGRGPGTGSHSGGGFACVRSVLAVVLAIVPVP